MGRATRRKKTMGKLAALGAGLALVVSLGLGGQALAADWHASNATTLNQAMNAGGVGSNSSDTLFIDAGITLNRDLNELSPSNPYAFTIQGQGNTINANGNSLFDLRDGNQNLGPVNQLTVRNADSPGLFATNGAVFILSDGNVTGDITNSSFSDNSALRGSVFYLPKGNFAGNISQSNFTGNSATALVSLAARNGGAIYLGEGNFTGSISETNFTNNQAILGNGGAIYLDQGDFTGGISQTNFTGNTATLSGGAIYLEQGDFNGDIVNSAFTNNSALLGSGGAISLGDGNFTGDISQSSFTNNAALLGSGGAISLGNGNFTGNISQTSFTNNSALLNGGAIYLGEGNFTGSLNQSSFTDNSARQGGAIYLDNGNFTGDISQSSFTGNNATGLIPLSRNGGAIALGEGNFTGGISQSSFTNNSAGDDGGAIYLGDGDFTGSINQTSFTGNSAGEDGGAIYLDYGNFVGSISETSFTGNTAGDDGGAIALDEGNFTGNISHVQFTGNTADDDGGAIALDYGNFTGSITDSNFTGNSAGRDGGAIYLEYGNFAGNISETSFTGNTAESHGGAIALWDGDFAGDINKSSFTNNSAEYGGAIYLDDGNFTGSISQSSFTNNSAEYGGAIYLSYGNFTGSITDSNFTGNSAEYHGGAIRLFDGDFTGSIIGSKFTNNTADRDGGAIALNDGDFSGNIIDSNFTGNRATNGSGGAIALLGGDFSGNITNSLFTGNTAGEYGGAIVVKNEFSGNIIGSKFTNNTADNDGGAISLWYGDFSGSIDNATFINNSAGDDGGAIDLWHGNFSGNIANTQFTGNTAGEDGGAINLKDGNFTGSIIDSKFTGNRATNGSGGAISLEVGDFSGNITNSQFIDNTAGEHGGAIVLWYGDLSGNIIDSNFTGNTAGVYGGAIATEYFSGNIVDTVFTDNTAGLYGGALYVDGEFSGNIDGAVFLKNSAYDPDGVNETAGGAIAASHFSGNITDSVFAYNTADLGGAIAAHDFNGNITDSIFAYNTADDGGAIVADRVNGYITGTGFFHNEALWGGAISAGSLRLAINDSAMVSNWAEYDGGAIYVENDAHLVIMDSMISHNRAADGLGGAVYVGAWSDDPTDTVEIGLGASANRITAFYGNKDSYGLNSFHIGDGSDNNIDVNMYITGYGVTLLNDPIRVNLAGYNDPTFTLAQDDWYGDGGKFFWNNVNYLSATGGSNINLGTGSTYLMSAFTAYTADGNDLSVYLGEDNRISLDTHHRSPNMAAFDYSDAGLGSSFVADGATIVAPFSLYKQKGRYLLVDASDLPSFDLTNVDFYVERSRYFNARVTVDEADQQVWLNVNYDPQISSNPNVQRALPALTQFFSDTMEGLSIILDDRFFYVIGDLDSIVPEAAVSQGFVGLNLHSNAARMALRQAFNDQGRAGYEYTGASLTSQAMSVFNLAASGNMFRGGNPDSPHLIGPGSRSSDQFSMTSYLAPSAGLLESWNPASERTKTRFMQANIDRSIPSSDDASVASAPLTDGYGLRFWTGYLGSFDSADSRKGYSGYDVTTNGFLLGMSWDINPCWTVGAYGGYSYTETNYDIEADIDTDSGHFGLFGRYTAPFGLKVTGDVAYSFHSNDMTRSPRGVEGSKGSFDQNIWSVALNIAYDIIPWENGVITPFVNVSQTWMDQDGFTEDGGPFSSDLDSFTYDNFATIVGATIAHDFIINESVIITPSLTAAWRYDFGDRQMTTDTYFTAPIISNAAPITYTIGGRPQEPNALIVDAAIDAMFKTDSGITWGLKAAYGLEMRGDSQDHTVFGGFEVRF